MKHDVWIRLWLTFFLTGALTQIASAEPLPNAWQITDSSTSGSTLLYYTNQLTIGQQNAATNSTGGFHMTVVARMVEDLGGPQTMAMAYGMGNKRFLIWWDLDGNSNLVANLDSAGSYTLTINGAGHALYHTHEIIYNPTNGTARYLFDGQVISNNWGPASFTLPAGEVHWGASASGGRGTMRFNRVTFAITNNIVASYDAGTIGNPPIAPDPTNSSPPWKLFKGAGAGTSVTNVSPDISLLPEATTLNANQFTGSSARLNGQLNARGSQTVAWFEWGTDTNYGNMTAMQNVEPGESSVNAEVNGLFGGISYHYRLVASNAFGLSSGTNRFFYLGFPEIGISGLPGVFLSSMGWGDYDNDGWLDFLLTGDAPNFKSDDQQIWRNTGNGFNNVTTNVSTNFPSVRSGSVAWGDYDNDNRLDLLVTGFFLTNGAIAQLWRNTDNGFTDVSASVAPGLQGVGFSSVAWGDYDRDGRLDFLITGNYQNNTVSQIWRNTGNGFSNVTASVAPGLPAVLSSAVEWADYDNDGRLDFLLIGNVGLTPVCQLWRNTGSGFNNVTASVAPGLSGVTSGSMAWGDYDNDGRLDFLLTGQSTNAFENGFITQLWRNTPSGFSNVTASVAPDLPGVLDSSVAWGDYDSDGRLDFLLTGRKHDSILVSQLWRNTGSGFTNATSTVTPGLKGVSRGSAAWGDYDRDGRLDLFLTGEVDGPLDPPPISELRRNNLLASNAPPASPTGLSTTISGITATLSWNAAVDDLTPAAGLNYNLRIGSTPGATDVLSPMALSNGLRLLPALGNAQMATNVTFSLLPGRTYYWSVQALDTSFAGSPFAPEQQFVIPPLLVNPVRFPNGLFEFYFTNQTALNFDVLVSTNVAMPQTNWLNLGPALHLGGGLYRFTDAGATGNAQRYYLLQERDLGTKAREHR